jgi:hypothetical protein
MIKDPKAQAKMELFACASSPWIVADKLERWVDWPGARL